MKKLLLFAILLSTAFLSSCFKDNHVTDGVKDGFAPVYIRKADAFAVQSKAPQVLQNPGKLFLLGTTVFITDIGSGVHIVDNSNPSSPQKIGFISIPGVNDVSVRMNTLYADNLTDLIAIDISNLSSVTVTKRLKDIYPIDNQMYPSFATGYFECADTANGYVIRWEKKKLENPKCFR